MTENTPDPIGREILEPLQTFAVGQPYKLTCARCGRTGAGIAVHVETRGGVPARVPNRYCPDCRKLLP